MLYAWYLANARDLPWRIGPADRARGARPDPYAVWLSEIMLQQTTVMHAAPYYLKFIQRWPSVSDLAEADDADVMAAWAGLGYYARARNLLKCARQVSDLGGFPDTVKGLKALPGIGPYTAGALAALAFNRSEAAIDGNVERVFARLLAETTPFPKAKSKLSIIVSSLVPEKTPAEFAEGLMDLGAMICTPKQPNCPACPLISLCQAYRQGDPQTYPVKAPKTPKPERSGHAFLLTHQGHLLLERRAQTGLLGGMLGVPGSTWTEQASADCEGAPIGADWTYRGDVRHVFTHFSLVLKVWQAEWSGQRGSANVHGEWVAYEDISGLPTVFFKAVKLLSQTSPISER